MNNPEIDTNGWQTWYDENKIRHHDDDLPAVIWNNGDKIYYFHGKSHRTFGPVVEQNDGEIHWNWLDRNIFDE